MAKPPYTPEGIARQMIGHASAHLVQGQFLGGKHGVDIGVKDGPSLEAHIVRTIIAADTKVVQAVNGRDIYYQPRTNTLVVANPRVPDGGTGFRPDAHAGYFRDQLLRERQARFTRSGIEPELAMQPPDVLVGGYYARYPDAKTRQEEAVKRPPTVQDHFKAKPFTGQ